MQAAASRSETMGLELGPVGTFGPASPVRFLAVSPWAPVEALHRDCWQGVLDRPVRRPFHPHVTVDIDGGPTDGADDPAIELLGGYRASVTIDRVTVLEHHGRSAGVEPGWEPYLAYRFG